MLKLGEKVIYESNSNFELGTFGKIPMGDRKISITNLGNIIIEENSNFFKKEEKKYYYSYSENKRKLSVRLEGSSFVLQDDSLPFEVITNMTKDRAINKLVIKLSFEEFKNICHNQREFIADFDKDSAVFKIDGGELVLGSIDKMDSKIILQENTVSNYSNNLFVQNFSENTEENLRKIDLSINDVEYCNVGNNELNLKGYFYDDKKDEIIRDIYIFSNNKNLSEDLDERVKNNKKIGNLPNESSIFYGNICGTIDNIDYKNEEVFIVEYNNDLIFINKNRKNKILTIDVTKSVKLILDEDVVLYDSENLFNIITSSKNRSELNLNRLKDIDSENIGFTSNNMPFFLQHDASHLSIYKSGRKKLISIRNNEIKDIIINNEVKKQHEDFTQVELRFATNKISINLRNDVIPKIMKDAFVYSKKPMINKTPIPNMYMNWAKSVNDMILFNFFGNIYYMKMEIDKILSREITDEDRINIVNMLYYQIQSQKNQFDILSAYMPKSIEYGEVELFKKYNVKIDKKVFKLLQRQLFTLASQVNRHLSEIERSLSQLSFVIYSEFSTREFNTKLKNKQVGIGMAVSVASTVVMGAGLSVPFLAMQGMNLYSNKKIDDKNKEIESNKLNLFTNQAIDKLNHLIENMYPYYVSEANDSLYELFSVLGKQYTNHSNEEVKEELFNRIADIYVCKQMTLNNMTNMRKRDLVNEIYKTIDSNMNTYDAKMYLY